MAKVMAGARVEQDTLDRLDRIAKVMAERSEGAEVSRADATRVAIVLGVEVLEGKLGIVGAAQPPTTKKGAKPARKPKP